MDADFGYYTPLIMWMKQPPEKFIMTISPIFFFFLNIHGVIAIIWPNLGFVDSFEYILNNLLKTHGIFSL